jgi:hypothetical protein
MSSFAEGRFHFSRFTRKCRNSQYSRFLEWIVLSSKRAELLLPKMDTAQIFVKTTEDIRVGSRSVTSSDRREWVIEEISHCEERDAAKEKHMAAAPCDGIALTRNCG